jgi:hypothetical protein
MTAEMPERIWMPPYDGRLFATKTDDFETAYVRADIVDDAITAATALGVERGKEAAASTHTRTLEALAEAEKALKEAVDVFDGMMDDEINEDLLPRLRAALTLIANKPQGEAALTSSPG